MTRAMSSPQPSNDQQLTLIHDVDGLLASATDALRYPALSAALGGSRGLELRHELVRLLAPQMHLRAPRRLVRILCRLEGASYDEPVLLSDISTTGVRFLVQTDIPLDLTHFGEMRLHVKTSTGPRTLAVSLVRRIGGDDRFTDVACRFLSTDADHGQIVADVHSAIFGNGSSAVVPAADLSIP
jgi:PilZ domain-containing protein